MIPILTVGAPKSERTTVIVTKILTACRKALGYSSDFSVCFVTIKGPSVVCYIELYPTRIESLRWLVGEISDPRQDSCVDHLQPHHEAHLGGRCGKHNALLKFWLIEPKNMFTKSSVSTG